MKTGIIGLAHTGKTSLFRILTHAHLDAKAAHAAVHLGMAKVPDYRVDELAKMFKPKRTTHAVIEYVDVGGLVKDRAKDAAFLSELRQVDALVHVLRQFEDPALPHPAGSLNPARDADSVDVELMLNDLEQVERRLERIARDLKKKSDAVLEREQHLLERCRAALEQETPLREVEFAPEEVKSLTSFMFLSRKPMLFAVNLGDEEAAEIDQVIEKHNLAPLAAKPHSAVVPFCGKIEAELAELDEAEAAELMAGYGLKESGRDRLIHATYRLLGLISFLTCGETECRAWTIPRGTTAYEAAGVIHSDIQRGFVKAEVVRFEELVAAGSLAAARERGTLHLHGKDYLVQDGDVILFRHTG
jgi:GTP-binding protein YchF